MEDASAIWWLVGVLIAFLVLVEFFWVVWAIGQVKRNTRIMISQLDLLLRAHAVPADRRKHAIDSGETQLEWYPEPTPAQPPANSNT